MGSVAVASFCTLSSLLLLGKFLRVNVKLLQVLFLPASVVGGVVGLVVFQVTKAIDDGAHDYLLDNWAAGWSELPSFLINIVFASLFLGMNIPPVKKVWEASGPQFMYGQLLAWGQYTVGLFAGGLLMLHYDIPSAFGAIIPIGFEGGHGTAAGMKKTFESIDWDAGVNFALASATVGILSGIICGLTLVNWGARKGHVSVSKESLQRVTMTGIFKEEERPIAGLLTTSSESIDSLALHLGIVGLAVFAGYGAKEGLVALESTSSSLREHHFFTGFPLFPLCMLSGIIIQRVLMAFRLAHVVDRELVQRIAGLSLDFLVVAAVAVIQIETVANNLVPFLILMVVGIMWHLCFFLFACRYLVPDYWFERGIAELGQSMGVTATGLLLLRMVDPRNETPVLSVFSYKQLLHEPIMGGGIWTSLAVPLVHVLGVWPVFGITSGVFIAWVVVWYLYFRPLYARTPTVVHLNADKIPCDDDSHLEEGGTPYSKLLDEEAQSDESQSQEPTAAEDPYAADPRSENTTLND